MWRLRSANCYIRVTLLYFTLLTLSTASIRSPPTKLRCGSPPGLRRREYGYSTEIVRREYGLRVRIIAGFPCIISSLLSLQSTQLLPCLRKDQRGRPRQKVLIFAIHWSSGQPLFASCVLCRLVIRLASFLLLSSFPLFLCSSRSSKWSVAAVTCRHF